MHSTSAKEIFLYRLSRSVLWSVLMQIIFMCVFICGLNVNIIHPMLWITQTFTLLTKLNTWLYLIPLGSVIFAQSVFCSKEYISEPPCYTTRFSFIVHLFSIRNVLLSSLHMLSGGMTVWLYLTILDGENSQLLRQCKSIDISCLVEENLFLFLSGLWNGLYFFVNHHILKSALVTFPPIQERKFIQVKSSIYPLIKKAMRDSILPGLCFAFLYYCRGSIVRNILLNLLNITMENEPLDKIFSILTPSLIFYTWAFSSMFLTTMYSMNLLFNVYLTESFVFPIESNDNLITLSQALSENSEIIKKLAAQDLMEMSYKDKGRRTQVFSLSLPGGHSTNWTNLSNECLQIIDHYCYELNGIVDDNKVADISKGSNNNREPPPSPKQVKPIRIRNLAYASPIASPLQEIPNPNSAGCDTLQTIIKKQFYAVLISLSKKPGISFFFGELTELKVQWVMLRGQLVSRIAQGLSQLVAVSLKEDTFGVVQDDLPPIISSLLHLKQALDKLTKSGVVNRKSLRQDMTVQMLAELKSAVKRSIYKITVAFGGYMRMKDIPLDGEVYQALQPFLHMREG